MKPLIFLSSIFYLLSAVFAPAADVKFSELPNATSFQSGDLFIFARPGVGNYNIEATAQFPSALGLAGSAFKSTNTFDLAGSWIAATNGYPWGSLYDASGAGTTAATAATNGMAISTGIAAFVPTNTVQNYASNAAFGSALAQINITSNILNGQISGGGINASTGTNIAVFVSNNSSNLVYGNALTQINTTSNLLNSQINTSSNLNFANTITAVNTSSNLLEATAASMTNNMGLSSGLAAFRATNSLWDGQFTTNLINGSQVSAGNNITVTPSKIAGLGSTNYQVALADPINLSQANIGTAWLTNVVVPTNSLASTVVDFNKGFTSTNISAGLTFTDVANVTAGAFNSAIVRVTASGADRTLAFPVSWHTNLNFIGVVTNGFQMDLLVTVTAARTNIAQVLYP